ncbi:DNA polymerase beta superfamily protein [Lysinimonas soli]|uniref:DNA polymerase beta superfamily protein n=1 Tax=Lysinimonas soli TaxID=1074233 RepID=A0ABW0NQM5_9MICO
MRAIPDSMDAAVVTAIDDRLARLETDDGVRIVWAIEGGGRAWGFPSPDSDYDARFLYLRPLGDYLSPWDRRDVIETPLEVRRMFQP